MPEPVLTVRECAAADVNTIAARETPGANIAVRQFARAQRGESTYLVAWVGEIPAGSGELFFGELSELRNLHVDPVFQGRGLGTRLISAAENVCRARGEDNLAVGVATDNPGARRLYERLGYVGTGTFTTTAYSYLDDAGEHEATETDEQLVKKGLVTKRG